MRICKKRKIATNPCYFFYVIVECEKKQKKGLRTLEKDKTTVRKIAKIVIATAIILIATIILRNIILKINYPQKYSEYVEKYAKEFKIEKELIYAMIKAESNFKHDAVSSKGALGLMQILESTAYEVAGEIKLEITKEEIINPETNICLGTKYISNLIQRYGNIELAIASYNAGIGNVDNWIEEETIEEDGTDIENIPFKETNNYVRKILRDYKIYKQLYN